MTEEKKKKATFKGLGQLRTWGHDSIDWDPLIKSHGLDIPLESIDEMNDDEVIKVMDGIGLTFDKTYDITSIKRLLRKLMTTPFEVLELDLDIMNETELVEILRGLGVRADRGYGHAELRGMLRQLGRGEKPTAVSPIDVLRNRLIMLWDKYKSIIRDQLPPYCEFRCYDHPDLMVLGCYLINREKIEEELKK